MSDQLGNNGTWMEPKLVPQIESQELQQSLEEKAALVFGAAHLDTQLQVALQQIEALPAEIRSAVSTLMKVVKHRMWLVVEHESQRRDREYARIFVKLLRDMKMDPECKLLLDVLDVNAKPDFEGSLTDQLEHVLRLKIKSDLAKIDAVLQKPTEEIAE